MLPAFHFTGNARTLTEGKRVGVARARAEGKYKGRAPTARRQAKRVTTLHGEGLGASAIAAEVGISRASVYRLLAEARDVKVAA